MFKNIFANISAHGGPFSKPIFALKPWDGDGRFEYNKRYKKILPASLKNDFKNPKLRKKLELIGKKGFSFR